MGHKHSKAQNEEVDDDTFSNVAQTVGQSTELHEELATPESPKMEPETEHTTFKQPQETESNNDVMISYSHVDKDMMRALRECLTQNGLSVWVDVVGLGAGVDFLSKIGEAIVDSKAFISLLSEDSIKSKYCQDELALAYISNKPIFPVSVKSARELVPLMDTGMRLQLAGMKWIVINDMSEFDHRTAKLLKRMRKRLDSNKDLNKERTIEAKEEEQEAEDEMKEGKERFKTAANRYRFYTRQTVDEEEEGEEEDESAEVHLKFTENPNKFWDRHFQDSLEVTWEVFLEAIVTEFHEDLDSMYSNEDQQWLKNILYNEMEVAEFDGMLDKTTYLSFCTVEDELLPFWKRVEEQARESYAMREVFDMKSSVRIQAIENLAKIKGPAVMDALRDLLEDTEPNVRAVAAISLAKTGSSDRLTVKKVLKTLNDKDRLVREAGCIALGRLKAEAAVPRLVHIWRNDVMSSVRNAAELALNQISGPEVQKAMHIIGILTQEIHMLIEGVDK